MRGIFSMEMYKRSQGRLLRTLSAAGLGLIIGWGLLAVSTQLNAKKSEWVAKQQFILRSDLSNELNSLTVPKALLDGFQNFSVPISQDITELAVSVTEAGKTWQLLDKSSGTKFNLLLVDGQFQVWTTGFSAQTGDLIVYGSPSVIGMLAAWAIFGFYNWPRFADFLIATEAEMTKVSWSSKQDLKRATSVVLATLFLLAFFLFSVDWVWSWVLEKIGVRLEAKQGDQASLGVDSLLELCSFLAELG